MILCTLTVSLHLHCFRTEASTRSFAESLKALTEKTLPTKGMRLVGDLGKDLVDINWPSQPARQASPVFIHSLKYAGEAASAKLAKLRAFVKEQGAEAYVVADLSEIAWLFVLPL